MTPVKLHPDSDDTPDYVAEALAELHKQASGEGLIVDSDATQAIQTAVGNAIATVKLSEGDAIFLPKYRARFDKASKILADQAMVAARLDQAQYVNHQHVDWAIDKLQAWDFWPFKSGD